MNKNKVSVDYTVLTLWLAKELQNRGFECIGTGRNIKKEQFKVFYFEDSDELRQAIDEIQKEKQNAKTKEQKTKMQFNNQSKS